MEKYVARGGGGGLRIKRAVVRGVLRAAAQQVWYPYEAGLLKYRVRIRFGQEPGTMPAAWKFRLCLGRGYGFGGLRVSSRTPPGGRTTAGADLSVPA